MNKKLLFCFIFILCNFLSIFPDENPTLNEILDTYQYRYMRDSPFGGIKEFPDLQIKLLTYSENINPPSLLAAFYNDNFIGIYGVMYGNQPEIYYLYDFNGDGVFEYNGNSQYLIPPWLTYKINIPRNNLDEFFAICSEIYLMYNSNEGVNNQRLTEILSAIINKINTTTEYNRDIYYSFIQYFLYYNQIPEISLNIILALGDHIINITDKIVPLIVLYTDEALIKTGNNERALTYFLGLKNIDNDSIVAEYYIARLIDQQNSTNEHMDRFKNKYPRFWMLR